MTPVGKMFMERTSSFKGGHHGTGLTRVAKGAADTVDVQGVKVEETEDLQGTCTLMS